MGPPERFSYVRLGAPYRDVVRTWDRLLERLLDWVKSSPSASATGKHLHDIQAAEGGVAA